MSFITVGVIDYGVGNHASVVNSLKRLGFRLRVSADPGTLDQADILLLPGVGAFPVAMFALKECIPLEIKDQSFQNHPK